MNKKRPDGQTQLENDHKLTTEIIFNFSCRVQHKLHYLNSINISFIMNS